MSRPPKPKIDYGKLRYLPKNSSEALAIPMESMGIPALHEALAGGANDAARIAMAGLIARHGGKYTAEARGMAQSIANGHEPLPPVPEYMIKRHP